jgi:hypothetical protein
MSAGREDQNALPAVDTGVKTIWVGLQKLYTLLDYPELFDLVGQV